MPLPSKAVPVVARALQARGRMGARTASLRRSLGFPWTAPTWPGAVPRPAVERTLGPDFDTAWARSPAARGARALLLDGLVRPGVDAIASPVVAGVDRLAGVDGPVIFAANHASHLDTLLLLRCMPDRFRHRAVVAAAADYFFDRRLKAIGSALVISAIPIDRTSVSRRSLERFTALLEDGWSLVIFPEGGRTKDGWAQPFTRGAAFLATRCRVPVVPVHIEGTRRVIRKGGGGLHRATTHVSFGAPLHPVGGLADTRALSAEIERAVAVLADEQATDWWTARRRAVAGTTPVLQGPAVSAWRRSWTLGEGERTPSGRRWPA